MTHPIPEDSYDAEQPVDISRRGFRLLNTTAPATAAPAPRRPSMDVTAADLVPRLAPTAPATWGRRGTFNRATGGLLKLGPSTAERLHREAESVAKSTFPGLRTIAVANPKGGSGCSPAALIIAGLLADLRREPVAVWDTNECRGTLGYRAEVRDPDTTVKDVLDNLESLTRPGASAGELVAYMRRQKEGHLVLASAEGPDELQEITAAQTAAVHTLLSGRFSTVIADTGNNEAAPAFTYLMEHSDVLVVPTKPQEEHINFVLRMLNALERDERTSHLIGGAIIVVTSESGARLSSFWQEFFTDRGIRILHCPADPEINRSEAALRVSHLTRESRRAWTIVAAAVAEAAAQPTTRPAAPMSVI